MSRENDSWCPACRADMCRYCFIAMGDSSDPNSCLHDCIEATAARDRLIKEQGLPDLEHFPATAKEPMSEAAKAWMREGVHIVHVPPCEHDFGANDLCIYCREHKSLSQLSR